MRFQLFLAIIALAQPVLFAAASSPFETREFQFLQISDNSTQLYAFVSGGQVVVLDADTLAMVRAVKISTKLVTSGTDAKVIGSVMYVCSSVALVAVDMDAGEVKTATSLSAPAGVGGLNELFTVDSSVGVLFSASSPTASSRVYTQMYDSDTLSPFHTPQVVNSVSGVVRECVQALPASTGFVARCTTTASSAGEEFVRIVGAEMG
jgi:hypothetical protein